MSTSRMADRVARTLRLWFLFEDPVDARTYLRHGVSLMAAKYAVDVAIVWLSAHQLWSPLEYLFPSLVMRANQTSLPAGVQLVMVLWMLPFLWIGAGMSVRRASDAGRSPWIGLLFFVPIVNYVMMLVMCRWPSAAANTWSAGGREFTAVRRMESALQGLLASVAIGLPLVAFCTLVLKGYGLALFWGTPFVIGAVTAFLHNHRHARSLRETLIVVLLGQLVIGGSVLLFAIEGVVCVAMGLPIAAVLGIMGGMVGRAIALHTSARLAQAGLVALALPLLAMVERPTLSTGVHEVASAIVIDAPPEAVWPHVVGFPDLPRPTELLFRLGVAYPVRARIAGQGVGAIRRCEFSTGAFVEPITTWDAPSRLTFDVTDCPPPMRELSPWPEVHATHLNGYFRAVKGEFRLVRLPGGRTRLEGSTWYTLDIHPQVYWNLWADAIVESIHHRVLAHIRGQVEAARPATTAR